MQWIYSLQQEIVSVGIIVIIFVAANWWLLIVKPRLNTKVAKYRKKKKRRKKNNNYQLIISRVSVGIKHWSSVRRRAEDIYNIIPSRGVKHLTLYAVLRNYLLAIIGYCDALLEGWKAVVLNVSRAQPKEHEVVLIARCLEVPLCRKDSFASMKDLELIGRIVSILNKEVEGSIDITADEWEKIYEKTIRLEGDVSVLEKIKIKIAEEL